MIEKFNKNAKVEQFTNMLGIAVRLIVIDPLFVEKLFSGNLLYPFHRQSRNFWNGLCSLSRLIFQPFDQNNKCSAECMWHQQKQSITDKQTEDGQSDPHVALCSAGATKMPFFCKTFWPKEKL